jgi:hypothetical protein
MAFYFLIFRYLAQNRYLALSILMPDYTLGIFELSINDKKSILTQPLFLDSGRLILFILVLYAM